MSQGILELAKNTLLAQQTAMQIVGHNVANANTEGYVRQVPVSEPIAGTTWGTGSQTAGQGTRISAVERLEATFAKAQLDHQSATLGEASARQSVLAQVESLFSEFTEDGIVDNMGEMFNSFEEIGTDASNEASRQEAVLRAELLGDMLCERTESLHSMRTEIDDMLGERVQEANRLAANIAEYNRKIGEAGNDATINDLTGLRDQALTELSSLTGAYSIEQQNNQIDVMIGGRRIVQLNEVTELSLELDATNPGMRKICLGEVAEPEGLGGELAGLVSVRDNEVSAYIATMNEFAQTLADEMNTLHAGGFDLNGDAGLALFTYDSTSPATTFSINSAILDDPELLAASASGAVGDGANASAIGQLRNEKIFGGGKFSATEFYADFIGGVGSDCSAAADIVEAREAVVESLRNDYESQTGVSLNTEALELLRYQQVYNAATRILQISEEMMDALFAIAS